MVRVLAREQWQAAAAAHADRVDALTADHRARRRGGIPHPVEDFLFVYYPYSPAALRRWHPGPGVRLTGAAGTHRAGWHLCHTTGDAVELDVAAYRAARGARLAATAHLLAQTARREPALGCFGLHEWAMVYRGADDRRHPGWPLRLGRQGTDAVVESLPLRCTHVDAYRFFTPAAAPRNAIRLTRADQPDVEQPGCLHAGMDLYRHAMRLAPGVPSELVADCFDLARELRVLDMRASPYDLTALGLTPVPIETAAGRAAYVTAQRAYAARGQTLRARLLAACAALLETPAPSGAVPSPG